MTRRYFATTAVRRKGDLASVDFCRKTLTQNCAPTLSSLSSIWSEAAAWSQQTGMTSLSLEEKVYPLLLVVAFITMVSAFSPSKELDPLFCFFRFTARFSDYECIFSVIWRTVWSYLGFKEEETWTEGAPSSGRLVGWICALCSHDQFLSPKVCFVLLFWFCAFLSGVSLVTSSLAKGHLIGGVVATAKATNLFCCSPTKRENWF